MEPAFDADPLPTAAALLGLDVPSECLPGVRAALEGLADHLRVLDQATLPAGDA